MLFEVVAVALLFWFGGTGIIGAVTDQEVVTTLNTVFNFATVCLLIWHQQHVRRDVDPKLDQVQQSVEEAAAIARRTLGERRPGPRGTWDGTERRHER